MNNKELKTVIAEASWYMDHYFGCEVEQTDFCTCGMTEAKTKLRKAYEEL